MAGASLMSGFRRALSDWGSLIKGDNDNDTGVVEAEAEAILTGARGNEA